jgi:nitrogen regulatory protein PII
MKKVEIVLRRDSLHYVVERLSLLDGISAVYITASELINIHTSDESVKSLPSAKIEFIVDDEHVDEVIQLLVGDEKVTLGRMYVSAIDRAFELGYREGQRFRLALSSLIRVPRRYVYNEVTDYERLDQLMPTYYKSMHIRSSSDNTVVTEAEVMILDNLYKQISRHTLYPPAVHEIEVLSGYLEGSRMTETYTEVNDDTYLMLVADIRIKDSSIDTWSNTKHILEQYMKSYVKDLTKAIESRYGHV